MKVVFCTPTIKKPYPQYLDAMEASIPLVKEKWDEASAYEVGSPYISHARSGLLRRALDVKADVIVFIDHDLSWKPSDLVTLLETEGDVVAGTYRFKKDETEYMGSWFCDDGRPQMRDDGCIKAEMVPAGFLKVTRHAVAKFMLKFPDLIYGDPINPSVDLFNHGAWGGVWWGEDYSFSRRWREIGDIWLIPNLDLCHHGDKPYPGNLHEYLLRLPGGSHG